MREDEIWQQALAELRQPVAQVFFLSEKSAKQLREHTGDNYIDYQLPHYLLAKLIERIERMSKISLEEGYNGFKSIDDLPLTDDQKEMVLEWFAQKIWNGLDEPGHCKGYDPLVIEGNTAHSYIFNLNTGGRHHPFKDLAELESLLVQEMRQSAEYYARELATPPIKGKE